jgi:replicative DNA helicase
MDTAQERDPLDTSPTGAIITIKKQRDGITGKIKASFVKRYGFFAGYEDREWGVTGEKEMGKF